MNENKITIVTIVYNGEKSIEKTILSILNQTYTNIEYIIIDGGSTDGTLEIIKKYEDQISYWISESDAGIYDAMNKGIIKATGDWICFINSGDGLVNNSTLQNIIDNYRGLNEEFDVIYGNSIMIKNNGTSVLIKSSDKLNNLWKWPIFRHGAMLVKSSIQKKHPFNLSKKYKICADFDFIYKMYHLGYKFQYVDINFLFFEKEGVSDSKTQCAIDNKMVVTSYRHNIYYYIFHTIIIVKSFVIEKIINQIIKN